MGTGGSKQKGKPPTPTSFWVDEWGRYWSPYEGWWERIMQLWKPQEQKKLEETIARRITTLLSGGADPAELVQLVLDAKAQATFMGIQHGFDWAAMSRKEFNSTENTIITIFLKNLDLGAEDLCRKLDVLGKRIPRKKWRDLLQKEEKGLLWVEALKHPALYSDVHAYVASLRIKARRYRNAKFWQRVMKVDKRKKKARTTKGHSLSD